MATKQKRRATAELVTLEELGARMGGGSSEMALARLRIAGEEATTDWQGNAAVPAEVAEQIVAGYEAEMAEAYERQARYDAYLADHDRRRQEVWAEAYQKAAEETERQIMESDGPQFVNLNVAPRGLSGPARAAGREAAREAVAKFDKKNPLPKSPADLK